MSSAQRSPARSPTTRPKYVDINLLHLPVPGLVSIFHRVTGVAMFVFLIPAVLFLLQCTLGSEDGFNRWKGYFAEPVVKVILLGFVWAYMHHFFAGIRYLFLDLHIGVDLASARLSAKLVLVAGALATLLLGVRIW
jgi:succinate dehydrogenase / fumarate reductase cytochrome b subunit